MAQLVLGAVGAVLGSFVGAPQLGFAIGSAIGGALFAPTQKQRGPRLEDLKVSGTETGQPIPYFEGKFRTAGQIIWASDRRELATTTEQGKGGGGVESTTYTYEVDMLYLLSDCEADTFARVWNNGKLEYNNLPDAGIGSVVASSTTDLWRRITFYSGAADQLPDPTYEAAVGVGNAPAYRGRATVFIEGLQLGGNGQIPNLTFEVFRSVTLADVSLTFASLPRPSPVALQLAMVYKKTAWYMHNTSGGANPWNIFKSSNYGPFSFRRAVSLITRYASGLPVAVQTNGSPQVVYLSYNTSVISGGVNIESIDLETGAITGVAAYVPLSGADVCDPAQRRTAYDEVQKVYVICGKNPGGNDPNSPYVFRAVGASVTRVPTITGLNALAAWNGHIYALASITGVWRVRRYDYTGTYIDEVLDTLGAFGGSDLIPSGSWIRVDSDGQCWVFSPFHGRLFKITTTFEEVSTASNINTYTSNSMEGVFYCEDGFAAFGYEYSAPTNSFTFRRFKTPTAVQPTVQAVVERLCARAGLDSAQYDASALSTITRPVRSMAISQVTPIRQVMETLASSFFFGCSLSDKLYFRPRGGTSVATIPYEDLGAGEGDAQAEPLEIKVINQLEVPAQIALTYSNVNGDYNVATEYSDRLLTDQASTSAIQVPLGFTPSEAKGIAETLVADASAGVFTTAVSLMIDYARIEPTDVVSVVDADGSSYRMRVTKKTESGPVISLDLVADDASVLTSAGITSSDYLSSTTVVSRPDTLLRLLDIPILRDADDPLGIYAAFAGESTPWPGAALFKSPDGATYERRQTITDKAGMGATTSALPAWVGGFVFDETSTVTVRMDAGTLSSYTRDQIFDGLAPAYLIGSEIVYARSASLIAADTYLLSGFLRGLRGTEWASSGHLAAEDFTVLSASGLRREPMDTSEIGALRYFKAPTLGRALSTADARSITLAATGKKPFAPVGVRANFGSPEPFFTNVSLLLHFDGTNGQTTTVDSSQTPKAITLVGATLSSTSPKFGATSLNLTGTGTWASIPGSADLRMGAGDFTIELWVNVTTLNDGTILFFENGAGLTGFSYLFGSSAATGFLNFQWWVASTGYIIFTPAITPGQWYHLAAVRTGSIMTLYLDGVSVGSVNFGGGALQAATGGSIRLGQRLGGNFPLNGRIDDLRITKGVARYLSNFAPPTAAFPDLSAGAAIQLSWDRRSRLEKNFTNGYVPLGEAAASFEVDVWSDNTYTALKRTLTSGVESVEYTSTQQIADFGALQSALYFDVYQLSAVVGRGYKLRGAV